MSDGKIRGVIHFIDETKSYGQKGFRKRLVVLEQDKDRFTNYVPVEFIQDGCDSVDGLNLGDEVEIEYRLSGRKWQRDANSDVKYFVNVQALSYTTLSGSGPAADPEAVNKELAQTDQDDDDVPF